MHVYQQQQTPRRCRQPREHYGNLSLADRASWLLARWVRLPRSRRRRRIEEPVRSVSVGTSCRELVGQIYGVHAIQAQEITATVLLCRTQRRAEAYAKDLSTDPGVLGAAVTRYVIDEPGHRTAVALYVNRVKQQVPYVSDARDLWANGRMR